MWVFRSPWGGAGSRFGLKARGGPLAAVPPKTNRLARSGGRTIGDKATFT